MSNLLAGILFPVIIGISLLLSLYPKKKKVAKQSPLVEFKMSVPRNFPEVLRQNTPSSFYRANRRPSLQIRLPKLVD